MALTLMQTHAHLLHSQSRTLNVTVITQKEAATSSSAQNPQFGSFGSQKGKYQQNRKKKTC